MFCLFPCTRQTSKIKSLSIRKGKCGVCVFESQWDQADYNDYHHEGIINRTGLVIATWRFYNFKNSFSHTILTWKWKDQNSGLLPAPSSPPALSQTSLNSFLSMSAIYSLKKQLLRLSYTKGGGAEMQSYDANSSCSSFLFVYLFCLFGCARS